MRQPHHRSAQAWHALSRNHTVLPGTSVFVHERNEPKAVSLLVRIVNQDIKLSIGPVVLVVIVVVVNQCL